MSTENDIQNKVFEKIRAGSITMRSRFFFVLRAVLVGTVAVLVLAVMLFSLSFIFFSVHASGTRFLLEFGGSGFLTFISLFPWVFLLAVILLLCVLEFLMHRYTVAYRFSFLRIFGWVLGIGIAGSLLLSVTPIHSFLLSQADRDGLPFLGSLYEHIHDSHNDRGVYRGTVTSIGADQFVISHSDFDRDSDEGTWTVVPPSGFDLETLTPGEKMYVAGQQRGESVYAYGIRAVK